MNKCKWNNERCENISEDESNVAKRTLFIRRKCNNEEDNMIQGQCFHTDDESNFDICEKDYVNNGALAAKQHLQMEREDFSWVACRANTEIHT